MNKILLSFIFGIILFGVLPSTASAANATNFTGTPYVWGNPVTNSDGSVSAAMPNGWGSYGADPFDTWAGTNVDNGQKWTINNRWLDDWGGRKTVELLGLNFTIYNTPGSCPLQEIAAGRKTNVICGSNSGRNVPPGSWTLYDGRNNNTAVTLEAFADWFLIGRDDIAKYAFENLWNPKFECYGGLNTIRHTMTYRLGIDGTVNLNLSLDEIKKNVENSLCQTSTSQIPATQPTTNTGSTGTLNGGGTGTSATIDAKTTAELAQTEALVNSVRTRYEQIMKQLGVSSISELINTNATIPTYLLPSSTNTSTPGSSCYVFNSDLKLGSTGLDVTNLTTRLVAEGLLSSQSNSFDQTVFAGVVAYQEKYASQILTPVGLTSGTGYFGKSTRDYMNSKCTSGTINTANQANTLPSNTVPPTNPPTSGGTFTPAPRLKEVDLSTLIFEKPLSSTIPKVSPSCPAWTSPTGLTPQDPEFYRGGVADKAPGEYEYRQSRPGMWYDRDYVDYNGGIATSPAPIFFGNIGFNPFSTSKGVATSNNLSLKKGDTWILSDGGISLEGHKKVLSLLGVPPTPQKGEDDYIAQMRKYPAVSIFMNSYTLMYAKMFMQCEDDLARFMFINRNHPIFKTQFGAGYMYPRSGYDSPESFMSDAKANISYINREVSEQNRQADISDGISGVSTQTPQTNTQGGSTLTSKQIQDIQSQITALLSQVKVLQTQLAKLQASQ